MNTKLTSITIKPQTTPKPNPFQIFPFIVERLKNYLKREETGLIPPYSVMFFDLRMKFEEFRFPNMPNPGQFCFFEIHNLLAELEYKRVFIKDSCSTSTNQTLLETELLIIDEFLALTQELMLVASGLPHLYWGAHLYYYDNEEREVHCGTFIKHISDEDVEIEKKWGDFKRITLKNWRVFKVTKK